ncbi:MAG: ankyrin repeat domain-containing protein [Kiritimatiellaeota bacterium]|nr:ankyrin repeat domain-containing protein [Kiritimatiellota bacterium]
MKTASIAFMLMWLLMTFTPGYSQESLVYGTMHEAAKQGNLADVQQHLQRGADINAKDKDGYTPLMAAAINGNLDVVKVLVDKGADVNARAEDGNTALELAKVNRHPDVVEFLKQHGAKEPTSTSHAP